MNTVFQKYAAALLPFLVLVVGASQTVLKDPLNWVSNITFAILILGAIVTYVVSLVPDAAWQGRLKTGVAIITTILAAVLPFLLPNGINPSASIPVVVVAILNALATELGVQIRTAALDVPAAIVTTHSHVLGSDLPILVNAPVNVPTSAPAVIAFPTDGATSAVGYSAPVVTVAPVAAAALPPVGNVVPPAV